MRIPKSLLVVISLPLVALAVATATGAGGSRPPGNALDPNEVATGGKIKFARTNLYIEYNASAGDIGVQLSLDGEPWKLLNIFDPSGKRISTIQNRGSLRLQGFTELFWESSEPPLADLPLPVFFARFPEGEYDFEGITIEGNQIEGTAVFTHALPEIPVVIWPEPGVEQDPENLDICWKDVPNPPGSEIVEYQVTVTTLVTKRTFSVHVPASVTSVSVPAEFMEFGTDYEFEVLAIEAGHNQTIFASTFSTMK